MFTMHLSWEPVVSGPPAGTLLTVTIVAAAAYDSLTREGVSAGPVVATLAVLALVVVIAVLAVAYFMHLKDRR